MERTVCLLCGAENGRPLLRRPTPRHVVCRRCGLVYQNPRPTLKEIAAYYQRGYWENRGRVVLHATQPVTDASRDRGRAVVNWIRPFVESQDLVVEIGCGHGEIISYVHKQLGCRVVGVEPSHAQAEAAAKRFGIEVIESDLEGLDLAGRRAKVLILSHVAEHFHDPRAAFVRCGDALVDNGWIVVEVPNILYPNTNKRLSKWLSMEHMYYFSRRTLSRVLLEAGYQIVDSQCAEFVRVVARKSPTSAERGAEPFVNEYRQVVRALWRHEFRYWPKYFARRVTSKLRKPYQLKTLP
jgi:SAM-dependent methyltransferase